MSVEINKISLLFSFIREPFFFHSFFSLFPPSAAHMIFRRASSSLPFSRSTHGMMLYISIKSWFYSLVVPLRKRQFRRDKQTRWWTEDRRMQLLAAWWWSDACMDSRWEVFESKMNMLRVRPKRDKALLVTHQKIIINSSLLYGISVNFARMLKLHQQTSQRWAARGTCPLDY